MSLVKWVHRYGFWDSRLAREDPNGVPVIPLDSLTEVVEGLRALDRMCAAHKIQDVDAHAVIYKLLAQLEELELVEAKELAALRATIEQQAQEIERLKAELSQAKRVGFDIERKDFWYWNDDEYDHLDTLICPVVVRPEKIKEWKQQLAAMTTEREAACGELMVSLDDAPIGSLAGKLVTANRVLRSQLATAQARCREMETELQKEHERSTAHFDLCVHKDTELAQLQATLAAREAERDEAEQSLLRKGYRKECDIPACNCGPQWNHGGHAETRLNEIGQALPWVNGQTILMRVDNLVAENANLTAERDAAVQEAGRLREVLDEFFHYGYDRNKCDKALKGQH